MLIDMGRVVIKNMVMVIEVIENFGIFVFMKCVMV